MVNYSLWNNDWIEVLGANRIVPTVMKISLVVSLCRSTSLQTKRESRTCRKVLMHSIGSNVVIGAGKFLILTLSVSLCFSTVLFLLLMPLYHHPVITRDDVRWHTFLLFFRLVDIPHIARLHQQNMRRENFCRKKPSFAEWYYGVIICNVCINIIKMHARKM